MFDHSPSVTYFVNAHGIAWTIISSPAPAQNRFGGLQSGQGRPRPTGVRHCGVRLSVVRRSSRAPLSRVWQEAGWGAAATAAASTTPPNVREKRIVRAPGDGGPN